MSSNMNRLKELIKEELERSEDELRSELEKTNNSNYRHQLFGELLSFEKIKLFLGKLGEPSNSSDDTGEQGELSGLELPSDVHSFVIAAKSGQVFENSHGAFETINSDVYKVMYYIFNEDVAPKSVKDWVYKNRDLFAREWLRM